MEGRSVFTKKITYALLIVMFGISKSQEIKFNPLREDRYRTGLFASLPGMRK